MKREAAVPAPWRELWGIALTGVSAVLLLCVLWQVSRTGNDAIDRSTLQRERAALYEANRVVAVLDVVAAFRRALVLDQPDRIARAAQAERAFRRVGADLESGSAAVLGLEKRWNGIHTYWLRKGIALQPGPHAFEQSTGLVTQVYGFSRLYKTRQT
jgi:hypothetical protein